MKLLLSMGLPDPASPTAAPRLRPALRQLDTATGEVTTLLSPVPFFDPDPAEHAECTGSRLDGDRLLQCLRREILHIDLASRSILHRLSHPLMLDVHDAAWLPDGRLVVVSTGNDSLLTFEGDRLVEHQWLRPDGTSVTAPARPPGFDAFWGHTADFRLLPCDAFKPRPVHPNRVELVDGELLVTGLMDRRCRRSGRPWLTFDRPPHDGRLMDGALWFTTVDGQVLEVDPVDARVLQSVDLNQLDPAPGLPGWCRSVDKRASRLYVGLSMLRATRHRELLRVVLRGRAGLKRPTRVLEIDLDHPGPPRSFPVGEPGGGTIYAIHALSGLAG